MAGKQKLDFFDAFVAAHAVTHDMTSKSFWRKSAAADGVQQERARLPYDERSSDSQMAWIHTELREHLIFLVAPQRCVYCREIYTPRQNIGQMQCSWHPRPAVNGRHRCCNSSDGLHGCRRCDHSPERSSQRWSTTNFHIKIPYLLLSHVDCTPDQTDGTLWQNTEDPARSYMFVPRVQLQPGDLNHWQLLQTG